VNWIWCHSLNMWHIQWCSFFDSRLLICIYIAYTQYIAIYWYTIHNRLYIVHYTPYIDTQYTIHIQNMPYTIYETPYTIYRTSYTICHTSYMTNLPCSFQSHLLYMDKCTKHLPILGRFHSTHSFLSGIL